MGRRLRLRVEMENGMSRQQLAEELADLAERFNITVVAECDSVDMVATPDQYPDDVLRAYQRELCLQHYPES